FHERLTGAGMPFVGFVVNKVHPSRPVAAGVPQIQAALAANHCVAALGLSATTHRMAAQALAAAHGGLGALAGAGQEAVARMRGAGSERALLVQVPLLRDDVHDVDRLVGLERYLFA